MDMGVDKPRHDKFRGQVDDFGVRRAGDAPADGGDLAVDDEDFGRAERPVRQAVPNISGQDHQGLFRRRQCVGGDRQQ